MPRSTDVTSDAGAAGPGAGTDPAGGSVSGDRGPVAGVVVGFPTRRRPTGGDGAGAFTIDCAGCVHQHSAVCDDCVVSFVVGREPEDALVVDADEARAVRLLERAGLVPGVRHEARASGL